MLSRVSRALVQISCFFISAKYHFGRSTTDLLMRMTTTTATTTVTAACRRCRWLKYTWLQQFHCNNKTSPAGAVVVARRRSLTSSSTNHISSRFLRHATSSSTSFSWFVKPSFVSRHRRGFFFKFHVIRKQVFRVSYIALGNSRRMHWTECCTSFNCIFTTPRNASDYVGDQTDADRQTDRRLTLRFCAWVPFCRSETSILLPWCCE